MLDLDTKPAEPIAVLPHQRAFILSDAKHTGLVAGFGSGKSLAGTVKTVAKKMQYPGLDVAYYLPSYPLVRDIAVPNFKERLDAQRILYTYNEKHHEFTTALGRIILRSMDRPELIVGYQTAYSLIDEADIPVHAKMKKIFVKIVARCRANTPDGSLNCTDMISTPEGFGFMHEFFVKNGDRKGRHMIQASTRDNFFLPDDYIETLAEVYTDEELDAYLDGLFVNLNAGTVHKTFDRKLNHTDRTARAREHLHIGMDFNITNMNAVAHVVDGPVISAVGEITGAYDTQDMIGAIRDKWPRHRITVHPDASGDNRTTSASDTDIGLLKKARFRVSAATTNPRVRDRITAMNAGFRSASGERTYMVNTNECPEYTEALERLPYKNGRPDKSSGFDHLCEAGGYAYYDLKKSKYVRLYARAS